MSAPVRVRFAPSPTGQLHLGNVRTALFNWLFARHERGEFVLRLEDTDIDRQQSGSEEAIYEDLAWLGLDWDEGPEPGGGDKGPHGPYRQSQRGEFYDRAFKRLEERGAVYPCFCSEMLLEQDRVAALAAGRTPGYSGRCAAIDPADAQARAAAGDPRAFRFRVGHYGVVTDLLRGEVDFRSREAFDPVIRRKDGRPTYNFAAVVDDAAMEITHVIRGEDHLTNTALQLRLYEELGLSPPRFAHLSLILGADGAPLSKRHGASSVGELKARGYPPEAIINSLALLGWTPPGDRVLVGRDEMVALFDLAHVSATPAIFDEAKLDWISAQKIRAMDRVERGRTIGERLRAAGLLRTEPPDGLAEFLAELGDLLATSLDRFEQAPERCRFIFEYDPEAALSSGALEGEGARAVLETFASLLEQAGGVERETVSGLIEAAKKATGLTGRDLLHPLRAAVTGQPSGPDLARVLPLIEKAARLRLVPGLPGPADRIRILLSRATSGKGA